MREKQAFLRSTKTQTQKHSILFLVVEVKNLTNKRFDLFVSRIGVGTGPLGLALVPLFPDESYLYLQKKVSFRVYGGFFSSEVYIASF